MNKRITVFDIALISLLSALLFVQEELLSFLPNIQFTVFLIVLFSKKLGLLRTTIIVIIHVILDNLYMSSFNIMYTPWMLIGWLIIPITLCTIFKKVNSNIILAFLGACYSFIYCWLYIIPNVMILEIDPLAYFVSDIPFELILAGSSFLSILLLYDPLSNVFEKLKIDVENGINYKK